MPSRLTVVRWGTKSSRSCRRTEGHAARQRNGTPPGQQNRSGRTAGRHAAAGVTEWLGAGRPEWLGAGVAAAGQPGAPRGGVRRGGRLGRATGPREAGYLVPVGAEGLGNARG